MPVADVDTRETAMALVETILDNVPYEGAAEERLTRAGYVFKDDGWATETRRVVILSPSYGIRAYKLDGDDFSFWFSITTENRRQKNSIDTMYSFLPMDADPIQVGISFLTRYS